MPSEVILLARAILAVPVEDRFLLSKAWIDEADLADMHRQKASAAHPVFGDGSLTSRLMRSKIPPITFADDPEFLTALKIAADAVLNHTRQ
jgi:hypothetical protein